MSSFTSPLVVEFLGKNKWRLSRTFEYRRGPDNKAIRVPAGFTTDFASIPKMFWSILSPYGRWGKAAVVHDYLYYINKEYTRKQADKIFKEAMGVLGVNWLIKGTMYRAVRWFGGGAWKKHRNSSGK